ncbi:MAG: nitroreductase family protein [Balneolaceae bacterium]|nr:nitroreductase family protein [Balneolaceae bacterium]MCH8548149.1 nitroreductase family protein [Balneolaceae bacterium]
MNLIEALNWRYAAKRMNGKKVPKDKVERILDAIRLSASSMGLQPYTILNIEDKELKEKLRPAAFNQPQVVEGSNLIVFAAWSHVSRKQIDEYITHMAHVREIPVKSLEDFRNTIIKMIENNSEEENFEWAARQIYLALGTALTAAAVEKVDATPMEGFKPAEVDRILGLEEMGLKSVSLLALGYRDAENDFLANARKVRRDKEKLIIHLN